MFLAMAFPVSHGHFLVKVGLATGQLCIGVSLVTSAEPEFGPSGYRPGALAAELLDHLRLFFCSSYKWRLFVLLASTSVSKTSLEESGGERIIGDPGFVP